MRKNWKSSLPAAGTGDAGAIRRSEQMATAMEARAFRVMPRRTSMRKLKMKNRDWICLGIFLFLMILPAALSFAL